MRLFGITNIPSVELAREWLLKVNTYLVKERHEPQEQAICLWIWRKGEDGGERWRRTGHLENSPQNRAIPS